MILNLIMFRLKWYLAMLYLKILYYFKSKKKIKEIKRINHLIIINNTYIIHNDEYHTFDINNVRLLKSPLECIAILNNDEDITHLFENFIIVSDVELTFNNVFKIHNIIPGEIKLIDLQCNERKINDFDKTILKA